MKSRQVVLTRGIDGVPVPDDFEVIDRELGGPDAGEVLVEHIYLSLDPYQRPAIAGRHGGSDGPMGKGDMPPGETVGQVLASRHADFEPGDYVRHFGGWQTHSVVSGDAAVRLDPRRAPLSAWLGALGMPGLTAWASIVALADVQAGQTVLVSAAAGPVGTTLGQIALHKGARVVGVAGTDDKCRFVVDELGFDACVNYKRDDFIEALQAAVPEGADIYHDNVGGQMLVDAMGVLKNYGTVILCGLMSSYNDPATAKGLYIGLPILKRAVIKGLVVYDFEDRRDEFIDLVAPWIASGEFKLKEDRAEGIERTGEQFCRLMRGENFGKALVVIRPEVMA